jgi:hypothetical protein
MDAQVSRADGCAGATLTLHHHKRTLHAAQLIFLGSTGGKTVPHKLYGFFVPEIQKFWLEGLGE